MSDEAQGWTPEDVGTLARFMGWEHQSFLGLNCWGPKGGMLREMVFLPDAFSPFTDARHDLQVLERVRQVWSEGDAGAMSAFYVSLAERVDASADLGWAIILRYSAGSYRPRCSCCST